MPKLYLNLRELLLVPAPWRTVRQTAEVVTAPGRTWSLWEEICIVRLEKTMCWSAHSLHRHIPKSYKHKPQGGFPQLISSLQHPMWEPHIVKHWLKCYLFSGFFFSQHCFWRIFLIDYAKNNPSGKDVAWLSEKGATSSSKLCYQYLRGLLLAFNHLICVKPLKTVSKVW